MREVPLEEEEEELEDDEQDDGDLLIRDEDIDDEELDELDDELEGRKGAALLNCWVTWLSRDILIWLRCSLDIR